MINKESIQLAFTEKFKTQSDLIVKSPGRINIIGEHTDYNNGFVLPAAINKYIYVALSKRNDSQINLYSTDYQEQYQTDLNNINLNAPEWAKYILGVSDLIQNKCNKLSGYNLYLIGDIPLGAGLSSSAALSCATGFGLNELFECGISRIQIAKIGQQTEHEYIGLKCGIMDQFASVLGKDNHAIKLDCESLEYDYVPLDWQNHEILLLNTNVKHNLASTAYNDRRESCEQGVLLVKNHFPEVKSLRDVTLEQLDQFVKPIDLNIYTKCRFIVEENNRVQSAIAAFANKNISLLGELLFTAHWALSKEYEVSCPELDFLISSAQQNENVIGARMMGGGFGGCTLNIVKKGEIENFIKTISPLYKEKFNLDLTPIKVEISNGSSVLI